MRFMQYKSTVKLGIKLQYMKIRQISNIITGLRHKV